MKVAPYNIKIVVYCQNESEARNVQGAITHISSGTNIIGADLLNFYSKYKQNESVVKPILSDVFRNGISAIAKHIPKLLKIR